MSYFTPVNQVKLTNVSIVRLKKGGKRFELACYPNKVIEWRNKVQTDLDEVLQTDTIFMQVGKGLAAKQEDLEECFKTSDRKKIVQEILTRGELQVSEKERDSQSASLLKDIATTVAEKCINPETKRPYPPSMIEKAIKDLHYSVKPNQPAKQQALDVIRQLQEKNIIAIARAQMRLKVMLPIKDAKRIVDPMKPLLAKIESEDWSADSYECTCLVDPGKYRQLDELISGETKGRGIVDVLNMRQMKDGDESLI